MQKGQTYFKLSLWLICAACWADSFYLLMALEPYGSKPHWANTRNSNCENNSAPLPWWGLSYWTAQPEGWHSQCSRSGLRHSILLSEKFPEPVWVGRWICLKYLAQRTGWALSHPAKMVLWRQCCVILKSFQVHFHCVKAVTQGKAKNME